MVRVGSCLLLVLLVSAVAQAQATVLKVKDFNAVGDGLNDNPDADGVAVLVFTPNKNETDVHVAIKRFEANTTYGVIISRDLGGGVLQPLIDDPIAIETNPAGNGQYKLVDPADDTSADIIEIYIDENNSNSFDPGEERAEGFIID